VFALYILKLVLIWKYYFDLFKEVHEFDPWALRVPIFVLIMHELMHEVIGARRHIESKKYWELLSIPNLMQVVNHCTHLLVLVFDIVV